MTSISILEKTTMNRSLISKAMGLSDDLVITLEYTDSKGQRTRRVVSPIRFVSGDSFLALCLSRCEPRRFQLGRCSNIQLRRASDYVMPVAMSVAS
jgi:predicted DNA-binding transcriptional regulator YafY